MRIFGVGEIVKRRRVIDADVMSLFGALVGDDNPIHHNADAAKAAGFSGPIAHGMVAGSMFSEILGNELPGPGAVYASQEFKFLAPIYVGEEVELVVEVTDVRPDQRVIKVRTTCHSADGRVCIDGAAVLIRRFVGGVRA